MSQPTEWDRGRLSDLTLATATWNPRSEPREFIHYVDVSAISREELRVLRAPAIPASAAPSRARKIVQADDTIFATVRPTLKRIAQIPRSLDGEIVSTAFCVLRPDRRKIDPDFLFFAAQLEALTSGVAALETGASYPAVRDSDVLSQVIPVPPLREQFDIAATLSAARAALLHQVECEAASIALKTAAMRELFMRGLRGEAQKETEIGPAPRNWEIVPLDDCSFVQTGAAKGRKLGDTETIEVPYLRVANVQDGHLDLAEMKGIPIRRTEIERYRLRNGDVVLTEGGDFDKLGRGFIWRGQIELCVHQNHIFAVRTDRSRMLPEFFAYQAQSPYGKAYFLKVAHKTTKLACINTTKLKAFPILLPPVQEQREIVAILDAIDRKIDLHRKKRAVLDQLFKALLHKLMTGEIRVADLDLSALVPGSADGLLAG
jgi:type I restriction enzyme S subunit